MSRKRRRERERDHPEVEPKGKLNPRAATHSTRRSIMRTVRKSASPNLYTEQQWLLGTVIRCWGFDWHSRRVEDSSLTFRPSNYSKWTEWTLFSLHSFRRPIQLGNRRSLVGCEFLQHPGQWRPGEKKNEKEHSKIKFSCQSLACSLVEGKKRVSAK